MSARPVLKAQSKRGRAFRASYQVSENSELFKKLEAGEQFHWERNSPATNQVASQADPKRHPPPGLNTAPFETVKCRWTGEAYRGVLGIRQKTVLSKVYKLISSVSILSMISRTKCRLIWIDLPFTAKFCSAPIKSPTAILAKIFNSVFSRVMDL